MTPNAVPLRIQPFEAGRRTPAAGGRGERPAADDMAQMRQMAQQFGITIDDTKPRVVIQFPANPSDMLLSGTLANGQFLANRAAAARSPARQGPRGDVRDPAVLALADAGHLHARLQRDHELERSRRREGRAGRGRHRGHPVTCSARLVQERNEGLH